MPVLPHLPVRLAISGSPPAVGRRGATLIELLVALMVTAVLSSIAIPALLAVRRAAADGVSLNRLSSNSQRFYTHAAGHGVFPVAPAPLGREDDGVRFNGDAPELYPRLTFPQGGGVAFYYFANEINWNLYLISLGDDPDTESWFSPSLDSPLDVLSRDNVIPEWARPAHYHFSHAFMASPAYFGENPSTRSVSLWRAQRPEDTAYPAVKALLFETPAGVAARHLNAPAGTAPTPIAFADGHTDTRALGDALPPAPNPPGHVPTRPLVQTLHGILGWDFPR